MYCPRCAAQNLDDVKFCRACGTDIRLVPQALMGAPPASLEHVRAEEIEREEKGREPARVDQGVQDIFKGIGFLCIFIVGMLVFHGAFWFTIWFLIPAFKLIGEGIGEIMRARQEQRRLMPLTDVSGNARPASLANPLDFKELSSPHTAEMIRTPTTVTEGTTRHLDAPHESSVKDA